MLLVTSGLLKEGCTHALGNSDVRSFFESPWSYAFSPLNEIAFKQSLVTRFVPRALSAEQSLKNYDELFYLFLSLPKGVPQGGVIMGLFLFEKIQANKMLYPLLVGLFYNKGSNRPLMTNHDCFGSPIFDAQNVHDYFVESVFAILVNCSVSILAKAGVKQGAIKNIIIS